MIINVGDTIKETLVISGEIINIGIKDVISKRYEYVEENDMNNKCKNI